MVSQTRLRLPEARLIFYKYRGNRGKYKACFSISGAHPIIM